MSILQIGLGRIGLPILSCLSVSNDIIGVDKNKNLISILNSGKLPFEEKGMEETIDFSNSEFYDSLSNCVNHEDIDTVIITSGTPYLGKVDYSYKQRAYKSIVSIIKDVMDNLETLTEPSFVIRTTVPVGTMDLVTKELSNIDLTYCPERLMEGEAISDELSVPKIYYSNTKKANDDLVSLFTSEGFDCKLLKTNSYREAECVKMLDNSWRNTKFAFANSFLQFTEDYKNKYGDEIDVSSVISLANNGYSRNIISKPGFVSGYCLGKDSYMFQSSIEDTSRKYLWTSAREVSDDLESMYIDKLITGGYSNVILLGAKFKPNILDFRNSTTLSMLDKLSSIYDIYEFDVTLFDESIGKDSYTTIPKDKYPMNFKFVTDIDENEFTDDTLVMVMSPEYLELSKLARNSVNCFIGW